MSAGNARIWTENARVHLFARRVYFSPLAANRYDIRKHLPAPQSVAARQAGGELFEDKMKRLTATLREQQKEAEKLDAAIAANLKELGYGG